MLENFKCIVQDIVHYMATWEVKEGLNEAQTQQVIVLRLLAALGYDIWNPFEVAAQQYMKESIPDIIVYNQNSPLFIIEIKALAKKLTEQDYKQAVNYVNPIGLRWAVLTNGIEWHFLDNVKQANSKEKCVLILNLKNPADIEQLFEVLNKKLWENSIEVESKIAQLIGFLKLKASIISYKEVYQINEQALQHLIRKELNIEQQRLAKTNYQALLAWFLSLDTKVISDVTAEFVMPMLKEENNAQERFGEISNTVIEKKVVEEILEYLYDKLINSKQKMTKNISHLTFLNYQLSASWRNLYICLAETYIAFNHEEVLESEETKQTEGYLLSNGKRLKVSLAQKEAQKKIVQLLKRLEIPEKTLKISYQNKLFYLP